MSDKKWINLMIFMISVMILLFLILQKNFNRNTHPIVITHGLITENFKPTMLRINGRWLPIEQLHAELNPEYWQQFEKAWKTLTPLAELANTTKFDESIQTIELVWVSKKSKLSFKLIQLDHSLLIYTLNYNRSLYRYDAIQAQMLLPNWLLDKIALP